VLASSQVLIVGTVTIAKKPGFAMSLWLHGDEDFISEAGAMNVFIIKQAQDGCKLL
jgi:branched-chain amino acid aminotransferase